MTDFGERVDLTANLASILRRYPFSTGLFREILQNSDDARATKQVFVLDRRQFGTKTLINKALAGLQGPAFLAYNDAVFSDADWEAIRTVSQSSKTADSEKIGKHGLGSRAYYHLTDNPQYLSGGHLVIFDPHRWAFEHGGWKQSLEEVASQHPDRLEPFESFLRDTSRTDFPGTVVRLTLRGASSESRISSKRVSANEIHDLLVEFIKQELDIVMLFLSHLTSVEVKEIGVDGLERTLASATACSRSPQALQLSDPTMAFTLVSRAITSASQVTSSLLSDWQIARASFPKEEFIDLLCDSLGASREWVTREVEREKLRSDVALAFSTNSSSHTMCGRLFTYLPLPLTTGFPCHIHGVFSLTDSRQNLRNPSETIMRETADALAVAWNRLLFDTLIPRTWLALLESIAACHSSLSFYDCLPPLQDRNTSGDATYWTSLLRDVVQLAYMRNARVWPLCTGSGGSSETPMYASLEDAFVAGAQDEGQLRALADAGLKIVIPSPSLRGVLLEACPSQDLSPHNARPALVERSEDVSGLPQTQKDLIVEFLLGLRDVRELIDVPVFQLVSGETAALEAGQAGRQEVHVLLDESAAELFGQFDANAINLRDVPATASVLLIDNGSKYLNVRPLDSSQCIAYIKNAQTKFSSEQAAGSLGAINGWLWRLAKTSLGGAWSWDRTVKWLAAFWGWVETCTFIRALQPHLKKLHLLPTTKGMVRSVEDQVFSYSYDVADAVRVALSGLGVNILDPRIPSKFFDRQIPKFTKSLSSAPDLLAAVGAISSMDVNENVADTFRAHLAVSLMDVARLTEVEKAILRALPIHPVLTPDAPTSLYTSLHRLPPNHVLRCVVNPASLPFPLPSLLNTTFLHCTADERHLIEKLDYDAVAQPLTTKSVLQLHVSHFTEQKPETRLTVLKYLIDHESLLTDSMKEQLRSSSVIYVDRGTRLLAPKDVVDPESPIADIVPPWDASAIFDDNGGINSQTTSALASLRLLRQDLDVKYLQARIICVAEFPAQSKQGLELARRLLSAVDRTWFNCSNVHYDHDLAWIPTNEGLQRPQDCRDEKHSLLCDRVMPILDMKPSMLQSAFLRKILGWDGPVPLDTIIAQLMNLLSEPHSMSRSKYLDVLTSHLGHRFKEITDAQLDEISSVARQVPWVLTSTGEPQFPLFAVFVLAERLRGFGQISPELARRPGVKEFLMLMGCSLSPTNDAIVDQLQQLQTIEQSRKAVQDCVQLLQALDVPSLTPLQREKLLAPGSDCRLHEIHGLYYNDLGSRAFLVESPSDSIQVHHDMPHDLCTALQISSLGSLHLDRLELDTESMREDLTTRIGNALRSYDIDQAFNEFLANAADAGAKKFNILLDYGTDRWAHHSEVLCQNMAQFCRGSAVIAHNDAEFTMRDIRGICRIGRGGKEDMEGTIGRFGLGALSFYHFSEVAMILSGSYIILLDPSGRHLPDGSTTNSYVVALDKMRGLYPGHLKLFHNLFGFNVEDAHYNGTIIRLPLRTEVQASKSALSKRPISTRDVCDMLDRYHAIAARSLFFIGVQEITASEARPGGAAPSQKWSVVAQRKDMQSDENDKPSFLDLKNIDFPFPVALPRIRQSSWLVVNMVIPPDQFPEHLRSVFDRNRLQQLSVALATKTTPRAVFGEDQTSDHYFFSSLPLPIPTSLPMHIHASFILAEDRRNIRWDGDGTLNRDSECNHWLLSTVLPPLYLRVIEFLNCNASEDPAPWPGNTVTDRGSDPISKALIDSLYSDRYLPVSTRQVFRSITGRLLDPSKAVVRGRMPQIVKDVLRQLRPDTLVELPHSVCSKVLAIQSIPRVSPQYVRDAISSSRECFLAACEKATLSKREAVQGVIRYMLPDDPKRLCIPGTSLHGLPLLALADGTLGNIEAEGGQTDRIYVGSWGRNPPWPLFSPTRFLNPEMDQKLFLGKGWNVFPWDESAVVALLREQIPEGTRREVSEIEREWTMAFWRFFDDSDLDKDKVLDALSSFPLIPTNDEHVLVSLVTATAFPAVSRPSLSSDAWLIDPLQRVGALIINVELHSTPASARMTKRLPRIVKDRLATVAFTRTRVLQTLHHLNTNGHNIETRFGTLPEGEQTRFASWLRDSFGNIPLFRSKSSSPDFINVARILPIWPAYHGSRPSQAVLKSLSETYIRLLPRHAEPAGSITPFLLADPRLWFIEYSEDISRLELIQPMSLTDFSRQLKFPSFLRNHDSLQPYKIVLNVIIKLGGPELSNFLRVPNGNLELIPTRSMYKSGIAEFDAALAHKPRQVFVHPQLRPYEQRLAAFGLQNELTFETFKECAAVIDQDFDKEAQSEDLNRCLVVYEWYTTRLPLSVTSAGEWRQLDAYSFIPTRLSRRLGEPTSFNDIAFAERLPRIVPPSRILRHEYSAVAWTQRALFHGTPNKRLFMADESIGIPTIEEVVKHLHVLATRIATQHPGDAGLLSDLKATYKYLQEHHHDAEMFLLRRRNEALFLNVDAPETESWELLPASQIMFNVPDEDDRREVRAFLRPFRELLLASGANEIKIPSAPSISPSSPEAHLSRFRASFEKQRQSKVLTDVVFRVAGATAIADGDHWAHRALLATASEYFYDLFCKKSGFLESRAASVEEPVVIKLEDDIELSCAGLALDHIYTGQFDETQDRECLLALMHLAHRWELADVQAKAEALLVRTITPGTYHELRENAEQINATSLLEKIDEFEQENAFILGEL